MSDSEISKPEQPPLCFYVVRHFDRSGVSGTGYVAQGTQWSSGRAAVHWFAGGSTVTQVWDSLEDFLRIHGHEGETSIEWINGEPGTEWLDRLPRDAECTA